MTRFKPYKFKEQDPMIKETLALLNGTTFAGVSRALLKSGGETISPGTLSNWKTGKSKRTYFSKIAAVGAVAGKELVWRNKR